MKIGVKVGDIMTRDFTSVKPDTSITECARLMIKKRVGSLIVKENNKLKGLLTERDIIWAMTKKSVRELNKIRVENLARKKIITIKPSADLYEALEKMRKSKYRRLPVVVKGDVIGFLTLKDILRIEPSLFDIAQSHRIFEIKEEREKLRRKQNITAENWIEGICEECGNPDILYREDGRLLCDDCRES